LCFKSVHINIYLEITHYVEIGFEQRLFLIQR